MVIGGFQKISLSDFPGVISSIVFTRGCGLRCPYCHNPQLVDPSKYGPVIPTRQVTSFLESRAGRIEGVVLTGGEPTCHPDLPELLAALRSIGLRAKLDTNGSNPGQLELVLSKGLVDFVAMDVKAPLALYSRVVNARVNQDEIRASIDLVRRSGLPHEFRTTYAPSALSFEELLLIAELVRGCQRYVIQAFRAGRTLSPAFARAPSPTEAELSEAAARFREAGVPTEIR